MPKLRNGFSKSKLITGSYAHGDPAKLKRKAVRAARRAVIEAQYYHNIRLSRAADGYPTNIMETRRILLDAERRYRDLTGEDCP